MNAKFFAGLGLFVQTDFIDGASCARLREGMRAGFQKAATVAERDAPDDVDARHRSTRLATPPPAEVSAIRDRLNSLAPRLAEHFGLPLSECQEPQFLIYRSGDFFRPHRDSSDREDVADYARERRVSAVVFLNDAAGPEGYAGGALTFYGLLPDPRANEVGLPFDASAGTLVAFRSETVHEVTPVTAGERFSLAAWFR